jgi:hypothetical protein
MTFDETARSERHDAVGITNFLSLAVIKIFPTRENDVGEATVGGHATGFFWQRSEELYLITNWHNVCAWDPIQHKPLSRNAFTPNRVDFIIELRRDLDDGRIKRDRRDVKLKLFDASGVPVWLEHPTYGRKVDVIALKVGDVGDAVLLNQPLNKYGDFVDFMPAVGDDAFVLGFPLGLEGGPGLPIWKRGSIATEPNYNLERLPKLLIDTATRKGMSGAAVIAKRSGLIAPSGSKGLSDTIIGTAERFLGVYSGRLGDDPMGVQLGIVWKAAVIDDIINGGKNGTSPFE